MFHVYNKLKKKKKKQYAIDELMDAICNQSTLSNKLNCITYVKQKKKYRLRARLKPFSVVMFKYMWNFCNNQTKLLKG